MSTKEQIWLTRLGYVLFLIAFSVILISNIIAGFKDIFCLVLLFAAGATALIGRTLSRIKVGGLVEIESKVSKIDDRLNSTEQGVSWLRQFMSFTMGNIMVSINQPPIRPGRLTSTTKQHSPSDYIYIDGFLNKIETEIKDMPLEKRLQTDQVITEIHHELAQREKSFLEAAAKEILNKFMELPREIRNEKTIQDAVKYLYRLLIRSLAEKIQIASAEAQPNVRSPVEETTAEVRRRAARHENSIADEIQQLLEVIQKLPESIRKSKGIDDMLKALQDLIERGLL